MKRTCTHCREQKDISAFPHRPSGRIEWQCRPCKAAAQRAYLTRKRGGPPRITKTKEQRAEEARIRVRKWHLLNVGRPRPPADPEKARARQRRWYARNKATVLAKCALRDKLNPEQRRERTQRRRARLLRAQVGRVDYAKILERDGMLCYLCAGSIAKSDLEFDHVVPLSRGGAHSDDNIRPTHAYCNRSKHARLPEELAA